MFKKIISIGASVMLAGGLVLATAAPAQAVQGSIRNDGPYNARILNGSEYNLPPNGQAYYANAYRVPAGFCSSSPTLGSYCAYNNTLWKGLPPGSHVIRVSRLV